MSKRLNLLLVACAGAVLLTGCEKSPNPKKAEKPPLTIEIDQRKPNLSGVVESARGDGTDYKLTLKDSGGYVVLTPQVLQQIYRESGQLEPNNEGLLALATKYINTTVHVAGSVTKDAEGKTYVRVTAATNFWQ